jgi:hypothetical protein
MRKKYWLSLIMLSILWVGCGSPEDSEKQKEVVQDASVVQEKDISKEKSPEKTPPEVPACTLGPMQALPASTKPHCSRSTVACLRQCSGASGSCSSTCLAADQTPQNASTGMACSGCTFYELMVCADKTECKSSLDKYRCCVKARCPLGNSACEKGCKAEIEKLYACVGTLANHCFEAFFAGKNVCFPKRYDKALCSKVELPKKVTEPAKRCAKKTSACVKACDASDVTCQFNCLSKDTTPADDKGVDCTTCVYNDYLACTASLGCKDQVQTQLCCETQNCMSSPDYTSCSQTICYEENQASEQCATAKASSCVQAFVQGQSKCYAE